MMKNFLLVVMLFCAGSLYAQSASVFPAPSAIEKQIAAKAADSTEVTLDKKMLGFAAHFLNKDNDKDKQAAEKLISGLDGIYVRKYEFDRPGAYTSDQLDQLRKAYLTPEWTPVVQKHSREGHFAESTDVYAKIVNGESRGIFVLTSDMDELTIVMILGPISMDDLAKLHSIGGLSKLGKIANSVQGVR